MKHQKGLVRTTLTLTLCLLLAGFNANAQSILTKNISVNVSGQRLENVLEIISNKGNFYFSYNSSIINKDSIVNMNVSDRSVGEVLKTLFPSGYEFRESGNYIILRRTPLTLTLVTSQTVNEDKFYAVSGYVMDDQTGERIRDASVYEKQRLASAITNENGYFKLKLKNKYRNAALTVSKEYYQDTTVNIRPGFDQQLKVTLVPMDITDQTITISPKNNQAPESIQVEVPINDSVSWLYTYLKKDSVVVEKTGIGKFLLSSKQKIQSINLNKFFTARPVQISLVPGLSTNGKLNSQVINNFSLNVFGGYSGGVNGAEIGGLFNIDKMDVKAFQVGGLFNMVGGHVEGMQVGGISNTVLDSLSGFQVGGVTNFVKGPVKGFQVGGVYNHVGGTMEGLQIGGVTNFTNDHTHGVQIAGVANITNGSMEGVQIGGVLNYAKKVKGLQIGVINVADTSEGFSIGLINVILKGYHKLSLSTNEAIDFNAAFKTGNKKLYSILFGGLSLKNDEKLYSFGYGLGSELSLGRSPLAINPELSSQYLYLGSWDYLNLQNKFSLNLTVKLGKWVSLFGGPSYTVYYSDQTVPKAGYAFSIPRSSYHKHVYSDNVTGWFGWTAGISFF